MPETDRDSILDALRRFQPMAMLDRADFALLADRVQLLKAVRGTRLIDIGSRDPRQLFLVEGELDLVADDGAQHRVRHGDPAADGPICRLRPSRYRVTTVTETRYLWVEQDALRQLGESGGSESMLVEESLRQTSRDDLIDDNATHGVMFDVLDDLNYGRIMVPSDPDIAIQVGRMLGQLGGDERQIANILSVCPALTLKAVRAARVADPQRRQVRSCRHAVERLGTAAVYDLAANCVLRESLRTRSATARARMRQWWQESVKVAAISRVLANMSERFDGEFAGLIGLLHSIAEPVLLQHAQRHSDLDDPARLDDVLRGNRAELGRILFSYWDLPRVVVEGAASCANWDYRHVGDADYIDILLVAQWHAAIGGERQHRLPRLENLPAAHQLGLDDPSPKLSIKILDAANSAVEESERLLSGK